MLKSMTGCASARAAQDGRELTLELKSVNHRYLDLNIRIPRTISFAEDTIRKELNISRGHVDVIVQYTNVREDSVEIELDTALAGKYVEAARRLYDEFGVENDLCASSLLRMNDVVSIRQKDEDKELVLGLLSHALSEATEALIAMREGEGERICRDLMEKLDTISKIKDDIALVAPEVVCDYRRRLTERLASLNSMVEADEWRVAQEIAIFADKASIDEELVRIRSHIDAFRALMDCCEPVGRKLDFLTQELNREFNTIGSKANSSTICACVIDAKAEIEKLREQVQNIE